MRYQGIKVTLVTGFLGAGKTSLIRHLLQQAPANERWAVLVNEFGEIGLDGAFLGDLGVAMKEVPGGCVCCTTSAAFQQGLNQLIRQYNPDRIFIEPSGLGHPKQIIQSLRSPTYQDVLLLTGTFCVLDARNLNDKRYTQHDIFVDQIQCADAIVFSHVDHYQSDDFAQIELYFDALVEQGGRPQCRVMDLMTLSKDRLDVALFDTVSLYNTSVERDEVHDHTDHSRIGYAQKDDLPWHYHKQQDAMQVIGWRWEKRFKFQSSGLISVIQKIMVLDGVFRLKGVFAISDTEALFVNVSRGEMDYKSAFWQADSRLEIIGDRESDWVHLVKTLIEDL